MDEVPTQSLRSAQQHRETEALRVLMSHHHTDGPQWCLCRRAGKHLSCHCETKEMLCPLQKTSPEYWQLLLE